MLRFSTVNQGVRIGLVFTDIQLLSYEVILGYKEIWTGSSTTMNFIEHAMLYV